MLKKLQKFLFQNILKKQIAKSFKCIVKFFMGKANSLHQTCVKKCFLKNCRAIFWKLGEKSWETCCMHWIIFCHLTSEEQKKAPIALSGWQIKFLHFFSVHSPTKRATDLASGLKKSLIFSFFYSQEISQFLF